VIKARVPKVPVSPTITSLLHLSRKQKDWPVQQTNVVLQIYKCII
jgi:hypothetical protein